MKTIVYHLDTNAEYADYVKDTLEKAGFGYAWFSCVKDFNRAILDCSPDILLLDTELPEENGFDLLCVMKERHPDVTCVILSAFGSEMDKVTGLNLGAEDYIVKSVGNMELIARVKAAARRRRGAGVLVSGELSLDCDAMTVTLGEEKLHLNRKEFELLKYCMRHQGVVLSRKTLLREIWGYDDTVTRTLDNHVARLRKMGVYQLETVFGVGYRFVKL